MPHFEAQWRRLMLWFAAIVVTWSLASAASAELDPLTGYWSTEEVYVDGEAFSSSGMRTSVEIYGGQVQVADHWTCGVVSEKLASGRMVVTSNQIDLYSTDAEGRMVGQSYSHLSRLPGNRLGFETKSEDGAVISLVFAREVNARTIWDCVGWR